MSLEKTFFVYIMTNKNNTVLYIGITNNIYRRVFEHQNSTMFEFASKYKTTKLVYVEQTSDVIAAIGREKQLKGWLRSKKDDLVTSMNPKWEDLSKKI